jgi:hypothetical protein
MYNFLQHEYEQYLLFWANVSSGAERQSSELKSYSCLPNKTAGSAGDVLEDDPTGRLKV